MALAQIQPRSRQRAKVHAPIRTLQAAVERATLQHGKPAIGDHTPNDKTFQAVIFGQDDILFLVSGDGYHIYEKARGKAVVIHSWRDIGIRGNAMLDAIAAMAEGFLPKPEPVCLAIVPVAPAKSAVAVKSGVTLTHEFMIGWMRAMHEALRSRWVIEIGKDCMDHTMLRINGKRVYVGKMFTGADLRAFYHALRGDVGGINGNTHGAIKRALGLLAKQGPEPFRCAGLVSVG